MITRNFSPGVILAFFLMAWSTTPAEAGRVRGSIVDREGKPAASAKVWIANLNYPGPIEVIHGSADDQGQFAIEAGEGTWVVFAVRGDEGGRVGWEFLAKVEAGHDPAPVTVKLRSPSKFRGRFLDAETGKPIPAGRFALDDGRRLEVDAEGRFEAPGLELTHHEAYPLCPGYERKRILFDTTNRPVAELELKLPRGGRIVGRVLDAAGQPVPGASIGLLTSGTIFSGAALWEKCADDGRFRYDGKPLGRTGRLTAIAPGYQNLERSDIVALETDNPTEILFTIQPDPTKPTTGSKPLAKPVAKPVDRRTVSGIVLGPDGKPVASAVVRWDLLVSSDAVPETTTNAQGEFRLEGVPASANVLSVMAKGLGASFPIVEAGGDREFKVELKAAATIRGRVVDEAGAPIEGVRVVPQINNPKPGWGGRVYLDEQTGRTDRYGRFTLEGMPDGVTCDVVAENFSSVRQRSLSASDESKNLVTLLGEGAIRGRVVDSQGKPVRNFRVQVGIPKGSKPGDPVGGYFAGYGGTGLAFTRDDGEFTISGLTTGNIHLLTVIAENHGAGIAERVEAQSIARLKPADALVIEMGPPYRLRVRVFQAGGKVVDGARVTLIQNEGLGHFQWGYSESTWDDSVTGSVNPDGWAEFPSLAFGKGTVVVRAKGFSRSRQVWVGDEEEFNIFLEPEAKLAGTVLDDDGKPFPGAMIRLSWGSNEMMNVAVDDRDGHFLVEGLGSGHYQIAISSNIGPNLFSGTIDLEPGKTQVENYRVKRPDPAAPAKRR